MKTCEKCQQEFPVKATVDGKIRNLQRRKFCLTCSPFGLHNTNSISPRPSKAIHGTIGEIRKLVCESHGETDYVCRSNGFKCKKCVVEAVTNSRRKRKSKLVNLHGGECVLCGYNKCQQALQFHHIEPNNKSFNISRANTRSIKELIEESKKCILLCANCHAEVENGITGI